MLPSSEPPSASTFLAAFCGRYEAERAIHERRERRFARVGTAILVVGLLALLVAAETKGLPGFVLSGLGLGAAIATMVSLREAAAGKRREADRALLVVRDWQALHDETERPGALPATAEISAAHPFAGDLDLGAPHGLLARLEFGGTALGRTRMRAWVLEAPSDQGPARQAAVRGLCGALALEEPLLQGFHRAASLRAVADRVKREAALEGLAAWGQEVPTPPAPWRRWFHGSLSVIGVASLGLAIAGILPWAVFGLVYALNYLVLAREEEAARLDGALADLAPLLPDLSSVASTIETASVTASELVRLQSTLRQHGGASRALLSLARWSERLSWRRNKFWVLSFDVIALVDPHWVAGVHAWQRAHGPALAEWLGALGEVEALAALARLAAANPTDVWPQFDGSGPNLVAEGLAHPFLPRRSRVGNDLEIRNDHRLLVVTGSNMSGKSTYLRAAGLAVRYATLGLPVPAKSLRIGTLGLATCMRVQDELATGVSRFQAEVQRLKACLDLATEVPQTLVLLDEILSGTNSRERHFGAVAVIHELVRRGAPTIVSTHDLGLAQALAAEKVATRTVHFRDLVRNGKMAFDYRLQDGLVPSTNALRVMREHGIAVPAAPGEGISSPVAAELDRA